MPKPALVSNYDFHHLPVLADEVLTTLENLPLELINDGLLIDATIGGGGHSSLLLEAYPSLRLIGLDQDPVAAAVATERLAPYSSRVEIISKNFADFTPPERAVMVLADLGVSSPQLDDGARGFSFQLDGPIDMRMNPSKNITAAKLLDSCNEKELAEIIFMNGEERFSRRIARKIKQDLLKKGPYKGTNSLAYAIAGCFPNKLRYGRIHPATKTFQALRIAVNNELDALDKLLQKSPDWLIPQGLLRLISFHSLEDRKVKQAFLGDSRLERITRKPITAKQEEISKNPRSRSAKYRIARRKSSVNLL
ncbi:16S rRNA (cytosine(1402)-N(4))-methyltransferase RsmH [Prochlorococcus sp. MIT 1300]|uniref:16S rRNA (cytosine(1402)-N(4))-methyltransferase RsmH n=1 Tax=Prochlorococcus sp. MIT 1300 TaxID=3096218 RepID=UPI002A75EF0C|nr:16S rRNA (cytosine(1402)-N(4))-methyltransferase RsmH [Prochlorococcus sp. MIT 1300]